MDGLTELYQDVDLPGIEMSNHRDVTLIGLILFLIISIPTIIIGYVTNNPNWASVVVSLFSTLALTLIYWYMATTSEKQRSVGERQAKIAKRHAEVAEQQKEIAQRQAELMEKQFEVDQTMKSILRAEHVPKVILTEYTLTGNKIKLSLENIGRGHAVDLRAKCDILVPDESIDGVAVSVSEHSSLSKSHIGDKPESVSEKTNEFFGPPFSPIEKPIQQSIGVEDSGRWKATPREEGGQLQRGDTREFAYIPDFDNRGGKADSKYTPLSIALKYIRPNHDQVAVKIWIEYDSIVPTNDEKYEEKIIETAGKLGSDTTLEDIIEDTSCQFESRFSKIKSLSR